MSRTPTKCSRCYGQWVPVDRRAMVTITLENGGTVTDTFALCDPCARDTTFRVRNRRLECIEFPEGVKAAPEKFDMLAFAAQAAGIRS